MAGVAPAELHTHIGLSDIVNHALSAALQDANDCSVNSLGPTDAFRFASIGPNSVKRAAAETILG